MAQDSSADNTVETQNEGVSILSPLRYPGSKRRLAGYIKSALKLNNIRPSLFVEPFAGGASVALQLLNDDVVDQIVLADLDPLLAAFWDVVFNDTDWLVGQIGTIEVTLAKWDEFKSIIPADKRNRALACLFLNRTSFSGILAGKVGPLGGRKQNPKYPIDCRFPRETLIDRVNQAAGLKDRVHGVWELDWQKTMARVQTERSNSPMWTTVFYYFDPPFFNKANKLYTHYFKEENHVSLRDAVLSLEDPWILSYDVAAQIEKLYGATEPARTTVELLYSTATGSQSAEEVILTNLISLPDETRLWTSYKQKNGADPSVEKSDTPPTSVEPADCHTQSTLLPHEGQIDTNTSARKC